jgi:hypothetical protein
MVPVASQRRAGAATDAVAARGTRQSRARRPGLGPAAAGFVLVAASLALTSCGTRYQRAYERAWAQLPPPPDSTVFRPESLLVRYVRATREKAMTVHYRPYVVRERGSLWQLQRQIGEERLRMALRVSRTDVAHAQKGDTILVPDQTDWIKLSPFPGLLPAAAKVNKLLLVSLRVQAFGAYENGVLVRWGPTSTGRQDKPTPPGIYSANWKSKERKSTIDDDWVLKWAVNLDSNEGIAIHEMGLPGRPASHSCVRLAEEDAQWFFAWADGWRVATANGKIVKRGTPVVVFGEFPYGRRRPWLYVLADYRATRVTPAELEDVVTTFIKLRRRNPTAPFIPFAPMGPPAPTSGNVASAPAAAPAAATSRAAAKPARGASGGGTIAGRPGTP